MSVWETIAAPVLKIIDKVVPDIAARDAAKNQFQTMIAQGQLAEELEQLKAVTTAQSDINKVEAASTNWFVAGGRPFIIWICGITLLSNYIVRPYLVAFTHVVVPTLDATELMPLLFGLLGLGGMRTIEKVKGVAGVH